MQHPGFFERAGPFALAQIVALGEAAPPAGAGAERMFEDAKPLEQAGQGHVSFLDNRKYVGQLRKTSAGAVLVNPDYLPDVPAGTLALTTKEPYRAFARVLAGFYPGAGRPRVLEFGGETGPVHSTAVIEEGAVIEPGAMIGREARIGRGTVICTGAVIGYRVTIGRDGFIGPGATLLHTLAGDRVIVHSGARLGQDGFGFAMGRQHFKVPQIGRVIVQDDVEIGANTTIDRGGLKDTIVGEGTKIDNLVQVGHNVLIGRHCIIVGQVGIAGSCELGDYVVVGGQAGIAGHLKIGAGAQLAAMAGVASDVPAGERYGGVPAQRIDKFWREVAALRNLTARKT